MILRCNISQEPLKISGSWLILQDNGMPLDDFLLPETRGPAKRRFPGLLDTGCGNGSRWGDLRGLVFLPLTIVVPLPAAWDQAAEWRPTDTVYKDAEDYDIFLPRPRFRKPCPGTSRIHGQQ